MPWVTLLCAKPSQIETLGRVVSYVFVCIPLRDESLFITWWFFSSGSSVAKEISTRHHRTVTREEACKDNVLVCCPNFFSYHGNCVSKWFIIIYYIPFCGQFVFPFMSKAQPSSYNYVVNLFFQLAFSSNNAHYLVGDWSSRKSGDYALLLGQDRWLSKY